MKVAGHLGQGARLVAVQPDGRQVEIRLAARRLFGTAPGCRRKTFAEQVDGLTTRYARKTPLLVGVLRRIAAALAGRAGSRLACGLCVPASRQIMLRLVMARCSAAPASRCYKRVLLTAQN